MPQPSPYLPEHSLQKLYDQDFVLWVDEIVARLKARDTSNLDWENLIEEIESLGKSQKRELKSRLGVLLTHILKRCYVSSPRDYRGWVNTIDEQRREINLLLEQSPSLRRYFTEVFDEVFGYALQQVRREYSRSLFPDDWQFNRELEDILAVDFWR